jgi:coenzyme PQQ precursor peptide PqqA
LRGPSAVNSRRRSDLFGVVGGQLFSAFPDGKRGSVRHARKCRERAGHAFPDTLNRGFRRGPASAEEAIMEWRTPKLIEIACGCEINAYFPADL